MTAKAYVESDWMYDGVKIGLIMHRSESLTQVMTWSTAVREIDAHEVAPDDAFLRLPDHLGRALYEALAAHYGGNVVDATRLRKDYDAERARVDLFIRHAIKGES